MFSVVTVAYEDDALPLALQARSLARFASPDDVGEVIVVENFTAGRAVDWRDTLRKAYGPLADRVRFLDASEVTELPEASGWWTQQVLKIAVAAHVGHDSYLLLDGKHHLVKPLSAGFVTAPDGRLRVRAANYTGHPLRPYLDTALRVFDLPQETALRFPTTAPPFPFDRATAMAIEANGRESHGSLGALMVAESLTEFFLYSAWLVAAGRLTDLYELHDIPYPSIWDGAQAPDRVRAAIDLSRNGESPVFGLHRAALPEMPKESQALIARYWAEIGLMLDEGDGLRHLRRCGAPSSGLRRMLGSMRAGIRPS